MGGGPFKAKQGCRGVQRAERRRKNSGTQLQKRRTGGNSGVETAELGARKRAKSPRRGIAGLSRASNSERGGLSFQAYVRGVLSELKRPPFTLLQPEGNIICEGGRKSLGQENMEIVQTKRHSKKVGERIRHTTGGKGNHVAVGSSTHRSP